MPIDVSGCMSTCAFDSMTGALGTLGGGGAPVITLATHVPEFVSHSDGLMHGGLQSMHILGGRAAGPSCCAVGFNSVHSNDTIVSIVDAMPRGLVRLRFDTSTPLRIVVSALITTAATNYDLGPTLHQDRWCTG